MLAIGLIFQKLLLAELRINFKYPLKLSLSNFSWSDLCTICRRSQAMNNHFQKILCDEERKNSWYTVRR